MNATMNAGDLAEWVNTRSDELDYDDCADTFAAFFGRAPVASDGDAGALYSHLCARQGEQDDEQVGVRGRL